ncbi:MAG: glycosyltransferase WbuB [Pigmentiphaga sp.]|uniref:glycosyltransferase WbuB n=1 Tax=Pigmentiphaga sp. TaxID=1977564 RepID=UPI0029AC40A3|nr:glycosyltransferase WbuB [Pigmentiphaga sp.]MDX3905552.1 glycosyltransferase WbuB [Pigmentiphaga sp.]
MKLLIYGLNFAPELTGIGKYTGELATWMARQGHTVSVIAGPPYYPAWRVQEGYSAWRYKQERWQGVSIMRAPLWVPARPGGLKRILHLASFALGSLPALIQQAAKRPDVIFVVAPALLCAPAALAAARLCGARAWLHIQDYEVDAAFELGLLKGNWLRRRVLSFERWLLRRFDRVSTISNRMLELALQKGVEDHRLVSLPNWVDVDFVALAEGRDRYRAELGIPRDAIVALYAGNMGAKQGLEILGEAAKLLEQHPRLWFVLCGEGPQREALRKSCADLPRVRFIGLQPAHRLGELLCTADIHLLPQRQHASDLVMPSKLGGMLASGRPVVCTAAPGTELAAVIAGRGVLVPPEDASALADALQALADDPCRRAELGAAARDYARRHLHIDAILSQAEQDLHTCLCQRRTA